MKLLFAGSLLVSVAVLAWAAIDWARYGVFAFPRPAEPPAPVYRFVAAGSDGPRPRGAILWQTSTAPGDCAEVVERRKREAKRRVADLLRVETAASADRDARDGEGKNPCAPFQLGEVEQGTRVEVLGECGRMAKVKILSGRLRSRQGCIRTERLSTDGGPAIDDARDGRAGSATSRPRSPRPR